MNDDYPRLELTARALFWAALVFAFVMAVLPQPPQLPVETTDKVQHITAFAVLTLLLTLGYRRLEAFRIVIAMGLFGAFIEIVQLIPELNRTADIADWLADMAAVVVMLTLSARWRGRTVG